MIDSNGRKYIQHIFNSMAQPFIALNMTPTHITICALLTGLIACTLTWFSAGSTLPYRLLIIGIGLISALFDILDGTVARLTNRSSPLGAFLDIIFDRIIEAAFITAWAWSHPETYWPCMVFLVLVIINFSIFLLATHIISNTGEKSFHYEGGLLERTETFLLFAIMLFFPQLSQLFLWLFNLLMVYTATQRFIRVIRQTQHNTHQGDPP